MRDDLKNYREENSFSLLTEDEAGYALLALVGVALLLDLLQRIGVWQ